MKIIPLLFRLLVILFIIYTPFNWVIEKANSYHSSPDLVVCIIVLFFYLIYYYYVFDWIQIHNIHYSHYYRVYHIIFRSYYWFDTSIWPFSIVLSTHHVTSWSLFFFKTSTFGLLITNCIEDFFILHHMTMEEEQSYSTANIILHHQFGLIHQQAQYSTFTITMCFSPSRASLKYKGRITKTTKTNSMDIVPIHRASGENEKLSRYPAFWDQHSTTSKSMKKLFRKTICHFLITVPQNHICRWFISFPAYQVIADDLLLFFLLLELWSHK